MSHFELVTTTKVSNEIPCKKYISKKTGITVVLADVQGPVVNGFFCLATEAHDDDGLPHTLEHLIFLGSKKYPYKGILDLLANRCLANGTNAWTDTDHTCYTIHTAGDEGMLTLLPVYLDHILFPTLTDEGFITEVHHVDEDGMDSGVVYCEMQGRENTADSRCELRLTRALYPNNGYSAETGGIMKNLRDSTTNEKVRDYHKKFYRPENLTIVLTGPIDAEAVFNILSGVEDDILEKRATESPEPWVKPWQTMPPPPSYGEYKEQWPCDTEDCGQVLIGWQGPCLTAADSQKDLLAISILLRYLCDTASAPLQKCLVEREDALAGDVSYNLTENLVASIKIELNSVPVDKLAACRDEALRQLAAIRDGGESIDMSRIGRLLRKQRREQLANLEADPHHVVAFRAIGDALYSRDVHDFVERMNPERGLDVLEKEPVEYWRGLLQRYFVDDRVIVMGSPSIELQDQMAKEEKERVEEQLRIMGEEGRQKRCKELADAIEYNSREPPAGTLSSFPLPSCEHLQFHQVNTWSSDGDECPHFNLKDIPMYTRISSVHTNFVYINVLFDMTDADENTRKWLPLNIGALAECPVLRGDQLISHEEVIETTEDITVMFHNTVGFGKTGNFEVGAYGNFVNIEVRCEESHYERVVDHLYEVLYTARVTKERLLVFAQRMINDISQIRRNGHKMVYDLLRDSLYKPNTNTHWSSILRQHGFLKRLIDQLTAGGDSAEAAVREANDTFSKITEKPWLHIVTDLNRIKISAEPWKKFNKGAKVAPPRLYHDSVLMSRDGGGGFVVGVGGLESSFLAHSAPGPDSYDAEVTAPLVVALNYFTQLEGPLWREIRGCGLSYGYGVRAHPAEAATVLSLYKATNAPAAYCKTRSIMTEFLSGKEFHEDMFVSAKSSAIYDLVAEVKCVADVVHQLLVNYIKQLPETHDRDMVTALSKVSPSSARAAAARWIPQLFSPQGKLSLVCHPTKVKQLQEAFNKIDVKLDAYESLELTHYNN